jgi:hypothetical protein
VDFIDQLEDFLAMFQVDEQQKLKITTTCLVGDARVFDKLKAVFLDHFRNLMAFPGYGAPFAERVWRRHYFICASSFR